MASGGSVELVHFDGGTFTSRRCRVGKDGVVRSLDQPAFSVASEACTVVRPGLLVLAASDLVLKAESDFHELRRRVVLRDLFTSSGDVMEMVRNGAVIACVCVALFIWIQVGNMGGQVADLTAAVKSLPKAVPSQVVAPAPTVTTAPAVGGGASGGR